jgi:hypothetical protein
MTQKLRYGTPISRPVQAEEVMFECHRGKVTVIDINGFMAEVKQGMNEKGRQLRTRWQVEDVAGPIGAFRLRYTVERLRSTTDNLTGGDSPTDRGGYSYGLSGWVVEPITANRGETLQDALAKGSEFRRVADELLPNQAVATFWVYPDGFTLYRALRDYLHERDVEVAGRPLTPQTPIAGSRHGMRSQGQ